VISPATSHNAVSTTAYNNGPARRSRPYVLGPGLREFPNTLLGSSVNSGNLPRIA
jgi:hypothetical protein